MSKHRGGGQPQFNRLSSRIKNFAKRWYKQVVNRANRRLVRQARDIETFQDKRLDAWDLD